MIILTEKDIISLIEQTLDNKFTKDRDFIRYTFYELRVKLNLKENNYIQFLKFAKIKLENMGYKVYYTGDKYFINDEVKYVKDNEILVAIKGEDNESKKRIEQTRNKTNRKRRSLFGR